MLKTYFINGINAGVVKDMPETLVIHVTLNPCTDKSEHAVYDCVFRGRKMQIFVDPKAPVETHQIGYVARHINPDEDIQRLITRGLFEILGRVGCS